MNLRKKLIKLAYQEPTLRKDLLPLVTKEAVDFTPLYLVPPSSRARYMGTVEFLYRLRDEYQRAVPQAYARVGKTLKSLSENWDVDLSQEASEFEQIAKLGKQAGEQYDAVIQALNKKQGEEARTKQAFNPVALSLVAIAVAAETLVKVLRYGKGSLSVRAVEAFLSRSEAVLDDNIDSQEATLLAVFDQYPDLRKMIVKAIDYQKQLLKKIRASYLF